MGIDGSASRIPLCLASAALSTFHFFKPIQELNSAFCTHLSMAALLLTTVLCKLTFNFSQVWPPKASSVDASQRKLDNLLESGNVNKAMQIAFSLLSAAGDSVSRNLTRSSES